MEFNIKNEESLNFGAGNNAYVGYNNGIVVSTSNLHAHSYKEPLLDSSPAQQLSRIDGPYSQPGIDSGSSVTYLENLAGTTNGDAYRLIKNELEDSQYSTQSYDIPNHTAQKQLPHYPNQPSYQSNSNFNQFFQSNSHQYPLDSILYSNRNYQKNIYSAADPKANYAEYTNGSNLPQLNENLLANSYLANKFSWFANCSRQAQTFGPMELDPLRQSNDSDSELSAGIGVEQSVTSDKTDEKKEKKTRERQKRSCEKEEKIDDGQPEEGKFDCEQCPYRGQSAAILKIHQRTHSGERPFSCHLCDYKAGQKYNVTKHILVHMNEKPYKCQYCEYRCAQKNNLIVHERTHTGVKPFACTFCEYKTVQKPNLVKHMYLHTNEKPYACEYCDYRCVQKTNLKKHAQKHLNNSTRKHDTAVPASFSCTLCPYTCGHRLGLVKHRQTKHAMALAKMNEEAEESLHEETPRSNPDESMETGKSGIDNAVS